MELVYRAGDGIHESEDVSWFNQKEFRFALKAFNKTDINRVSARQKFTFAASNQAELVAWKSFLTNLQVRVRIRCCGHRVLYLFLIVLPMD